MAISFDGPNKLMILSSGTTILSVRDLWSRWVDWYLTSDNSKYLPALENVGGNDIDEDEGTKIPIYAFCINGWKLRPQEATHTLKVGDGILLVSGGGDPFVDTLGSYIVRINYQQPVQAISFSTGEGGTGEADWTTTERSQIRHRLGIDGTVVAPSATPSLGTIANQQTIISNISSIDGKIDIIDGIVDNIQTDTNSIESKVDSLIDSVDRDIYNNMVTINTSSPYSGTDFPVGTYTYPVNNLADAITIAANEDFRKFRIIGNFTLHNGESFLGFYVEGDHPNLTTVTLESGSNIGGSIFSQLKLTGTCTGVADFEDCQLSSIINLSALTRNSNIVRCQLNTGTIQLASSSSPNYQFNFVNCWSGAVLDMSPIINVNDCSSKILFRNHSGAIRFQNITEGQRVSLDFVSGRVRFDASCTDMDAVVRGNVIIQNNSQVEIDDSATLVPINESLFIIDGIVDNIQTDTNSIESKVDIIDGIVDNIQTDTNSIESKVDIVDTNVDSILINLATTNVGVNTLLDVEQGDWEIDGNQMIFYTRTGIELMRFDLIYDGANVIARERV